MKTRSSLCLILVLLLSLTAPTHAEAAQGGRKTEITAEPYLPDIKIEVVVPTSGNVYINPNQLPVKIDGKVEDSQIVCDSFSIENLSEVPLNVSVEVTGTVKSESDMLLAAQSTKGSATTAKKAFIYFEIQTVSDPSAVSWASAYDANKHIVIRGSTKVKKNIVILDAGDQEKRFAMFHLAGDCIQDPREEWTSKDGVDVEIVFTFSPLPVGTEIP